jgi:hypothetical protein
MNQTLRIATITLDSVALAFFSIATVVSFILWYRHKKNNNPSRILSFIYSAYEDSPTEVFEPFMVRFKYSATFQWILLILFHFGCCAFGVVTIALEISNNFVKRNRPFYIYMGMLTNLSFHIFTIYHFLQIICCSVFFLHKRYVDATKY